DLIHIRRHFNNSDFLGEDNRAIDAALEVAHVQNEGIVNSIKNSATLRGILKFAQVLPDEKLRDAKNRFMEDFLSIGNEGGIVTTDQQAEFTPIENKPVTISGEQSALIRDKIYSYLGISQAIVDSTYSEDQFAAFYESVVEPIATALSLEFTRKLFNERELSFGNQIIFESGRLQFSSNRTKIELLKELMPLGLLTVNQALEVLNLAPVEGGERRLQTLNVVDADRATEYQLAKAYNGDRKGVMDNGISPNGNDGDNGDGDKTDET
ncbi:MAG: phage portal protein, partial [Selenomonadaceae bacterium]|nr:phage portal protein [Selenomonadaceae bacterium]